MCLCIARSQGDSLASTCLNAQTERLRAAGPVAFRLMLLLLLNAAQHNHSAQLLCLYNRIQTKPSMSALRKWESVPQAASQLNPTLCLPLWIRRRGTDSHFLFLRLADCGSEARPCSSVPLPATAASPGCQSHNDRANRRAEKQTWTEKRYGYPTL